MTEAEIRSTLRKWILARPKARGVRDLRDSTPLLNAGVLSSLDVVELILFIENMKGEEVDIETLEPGVLESIDTIYAGFFGSGKRVPTGLECRSDRPS